MSRKHSRRATSALTASALLFVCAGATAAIALDHSDQPNAASSTRPLAASSAPAPTTQPGAAFGVNGKVSTIPDPPAPKTTVNEAQARRGILKACQAAPPRYGETRAIGNGEINFTPYEWGMKFTLSPKAAEQYYASSRNRAGIGDFMNMFGLDQVPILGQIIKIITSLIGMGGGGGGGMPDIGSIIGNIGGLGGGGNGGLPGIGGGGGGLPGGAGDIPMPGGSDAGTGGGIGDIPIPSPSDAGSGGGIAPGDTDIPVAGGSGSTGSDLAPTGTLLPGDGSGDLPGGAPTATPSAGDLPGGAPSDGGSIPNVTIDPAAGGGARAGQYGLEINAPWLPFFAWQSKPTQPFQRAALSCS